MTKKVLNPVTLATIIVVLYMIMPVVSVFIGRYITTYAYMTLCVLLLGSILLFGGLKRLNSTLYLIAPFIIYIIITIFTRTGSLLLWGYQSMLFLLPIIIGYYYLYYKPENTSLLSAIIVFGIIVTVITTIIGLIQFNFAARILATISASDDPESIKYAWHNIGGYDFVYTCVLLYPILILAHKLRVINSIVFWVLIIDLFAIVILSEYTTALILILITSVLYFTSKNLNARQLLLLGILFFVILYVFWPFIAKFLLWLASALGSDTMAERLTALANGYSGLESSESNRVELYRLSIMGFLNSPIFGKILGSYTSSGGHSFILDTLSDYGIIGGASIVFMYRNIYRYFFLPFLQNEGSGFILWAFTQSVILSLINTGMWLIPLTFFIPVLISVLYKSNSGDVYENSLDS